MSAAGEGREGKGEGFAHAAPGASEEAAGRASEEAAGGACLCKEWLAHAGSLEEGLTHPGLRMQAAALCTRF